MSDRKVVREPLPVQEQQTAPGVHGPADGHANNTTMPSINNPSFQEGGTGTGINEDLRMSNAEREALYAGAQANSFAETIDSTDPGPYAADGTTGNIDQQGNVTIYEKGDLSGNYNVQSGIIECQDNTFKAPESACNAEFGM